MADIEVISVRVKDQYSGLWFDVYPAEGEANAYVTHQLECHYYTWLDRNVDLTFKVRNVADIPKAVGFKLFAYDQEKGYSTKVAELSKALEAGETWSETIKNIIPAPDFCPTLIYTHSWTVDGEQVESGHFRLRAAHFLFIYSNKPCKVNITSVPDHGYFDAFPAQSAYAFGYGTSVTTYAIPPFCHVFNYWEVDGTRYQENPITITMDANHIAMVYFEPAT